MNAVSGEREREINKIPIRHAKGIYFFKWMLNIKIAKVIFLFIYFLNVTNYKVHNIYMLERIKTSVT